MEEACFNDTEDHYHPTWLTLRRDFHDRRTQEAEAFNRLLTDHLHFSVEKWDCDHSGWNFELPSATIHVYHVASGQLVARADSQILPRKYLDGLRGELRKTVDEQEVISGGMIDLAGALLRAVEEAVAWEEIFDQKLANYEGLRTLPDELRKRLRQKKEEERRGFDARAIADYSSVLANPFGVNLSSVDDTAAFLLGKPLESICSTIREDFRILHVEPVFRTNLVSAFMERKQMMYDDLVRKSRGSLRVSVPSTVIRPGSVDDTTEGLAQHLATPRVTFHGAPRSVIESIVRYGFLVPGSQIGNSGQKLGIRCGSSFGTGIYSSPDASFASHYLDYRSGQIQLSQPSEVPGMRLIICATLMGRPLTVSRGEARRVEGILNRHAHSHVSENGLEYIVFEPSQIVPCYVLHLDYGAETALRQYDMLSKDPTNYFQRRSKGERYRMPEKSEATCPGDVQRKKQALKAAASKWFPYGYGTASGTSFVIEDMAEVSDDEEEYGDFQSQRIEQDNEMRAAREARLANGASWFDEYQMVRKSNQDLDVSAVDNSW